MKDLNGIKVFTEGNRDNKAIIFIHGFMFDHTMWKKQVDEFSDRYYCVTYDVRGCGASDVKDGQYTMEMFADDLEMIIDDLDLNKPVLCGLSMGGYVSGAAVSRDQSKYGGLILCDTRTDADSDEAKLKRANTIKTVNEKGVGFFAEDFAQNVFGEKFRDEKKSEFDEWLSFLKKNDPVGVKGCTLAMVSRRNVTPFLPELRIPVHAVCGEIDELSPPAEMKAMAEKIDACDLSIIDDAGHMSAVEKPEKFNSAVRKFLEKHID